MSSRGCECLDFLLPALTDDLSFFLTSHAPHFLSLTPTAPTQPAGPAPGFRFNLARSAAWSGLVHLRALRARSSRHHLTHATHEVCAEAVRITGIGSLSVTRAAPDRVAHHWTVLTYGRRRGGVQGALHASEGERPRVRAIETSIHLIDYCATLAPTSSVLLRLRGAVPPLNSSLTSSSPPDRSQSQARRRLHAAAACSSAACARSPRRAR
jgi:hypothetical protein